jgi:hypothetical protein
MELESLSKKIDNQGIEIKEIKEALLGSPFTQGKGMVEIQQEHDERLTALERIKDKVIWMAVGAGVAGGITIAKIISLVTEAFTK